MLASNRDVKGPDDWEDERLMPLTLRIQYRSQRLCKQSWISVFAVLHYYNMYRAQPSASIMYVQLTHPVSTHPVHAKLLVDQFPFRLISPDKRQTKP